MRNKEYVLGLSLWTLNDYRSKYNAEPPTAASWTTPPSQNRTWGIITTMGRPKRIYETTQKEYAPIKALALADINVAKGTANISITPRNKLDIPANILKGFKVKWSVFDTAFKALKVGEKILPQGYEVLNEIKYFATPSKPVIKHINQAIDGIRFVFDKIAGADEYAVQYKYNDSTYTTKKTINDFVEIDDKKIKQGQKLTCTLIAYNNAGQSEPSDAVVTAMNENDLPPAIWDAIRNKTNVFIGFEVLPKDDMYEIEYGFETAVYTKKLAFKNQGVVRLSHVPLDKPVYFRMRTKKQTGFTSDWSHEVKVE
jgi:hypothetical protein